MKSTVLLFSLFLVVHPFFDYQSHYKLHADQGLPKDETLTLKLAVKHRDNGVLQKKVIFKAFKISF